MKKILKLGLVFLCVLIFMAVVLKPFVFAQDSRIFYNSEEYKKIMNNKTHIVKVIKYSYPEGGFEKEDIKLDKALKKVESLKNLKKSNMAIADADWYYLFVFDDGSKVEVRFEGCLFHYKGQNYEIIE